MPDQIPGFRVCRQLRLELPQRLLIGDAQHFLGEGLQLYKADGHRQGDYTWYNRCQCGVPDGRPARFRSAVGGFLLVSARWKRVGNGVETKGGIWKRSRLRGNGGHFTANIRPCSALSKCVCSRVKKVRFRVRNLFPGSIPGPATPLYSCGFQGDWEVGSDPGRVPRVYRGGGRRPLLHSLDRECCPRPAASCGRANAL